MSTARRSFLKNAGFYSLSAVAGRLILPDVAENLSEAIARVGQLPLDQQAKDESFWRTVKNSYTVSPTILNLNNGGVSPQPLVVQEAVERYNRLSNEAPSYYMWRVLDKGREPLRQRMADLAGCSKEEIAFDRNASEALETIIFGLRLKAGDEVVLNNLDYPNMVNAWKQRAHRDGIVIKWVDAKLPNEDEESMVRAYVDAFTPRTKVVHLTHIINWMGQVIPIRPIADEARRRGIEVVVDGAHSFAHLDFKIPDLNCDYFGTSLHKWLCAPFGSGLIYVRKEKIGRLYPLFGAPDPEAEDIRKFEHLGTRSFAIEQAIGQALDFHLMIGSSRKFERLHYLKTYWTEKVTAFPGVSIGTSLLPDYSGAIALLKIDGKTGQEVSTALMNDHGIHTVAISHDLASGVRVTPNVYTLTSDLDRLVEAVKVIAMS